MIAMESFIPHFVGRFNDINPMHREKKKLNEPSISYYLQKFGSLYSLYVIIFFLTEEKRRGFDPDEEEEKSKKQHFQISTKASSANP